MAERTRTTHEDMAKSDLPFKPFLNVLLQAKLDGRALNAQEIFEEISTFIFAVC